MKIGRLIFYIHGHMKEKESVNLFEHAIRPSFETVSDLIEFNYRRFQFLEASMVFVVNLIEFWNNDTIYKNVKKYLYKYFTNWKFDIVLLITEKGD